MTGTSGAQGVKPGVLQRRLVGLCAAVAEKTEANLYGPVESIGRKGQCGLGREQVGDVAELSICCVAISQVGSAVPQGVHGDP